MKRIALALLVACLLSCVAFPVLAAETIETDLGTVVLGDETVEYFPLDKEKVANKEYINEELEAFIRSQLARNHMLGEILVTCYTDDIEETKTDLLQILDTVAPFEYDSHVSIKELVTYVFIADEEDLHDIMLALLENGYYAAVNGVTFNAEEGGRPDGVLIRYTRGNLDRCNDVDAQDYMKLKRIVLDTYTADETELLLADVNVDGEINAQDYMMVKRHVLGTYEITDTIDFWLN